MDVTFTLGDVLRWVALIVFVFGPAAVFWMAVICAVVIKGKKR